MISKQFSGFGIQCAGRWICCAVMALAIVASSRAETILLEHAIVHTVSGKTISPGSVLIQNGKIQGLFDDSLPTRAIYPSDAKIFDLKGQHLYPGMIALNTALGLTELSGVRSTRDLAEVGEYTPDVQSWIAVNPDSELLPVARANGVTHIQPAPQGGIVAGQSGLVVLDGWTTEQMTYKKPVALHVYWPSMDLDTTPKEKFKDKSKWKSPEDQAKERTKKLKELEDFFDEARAYANAREVAKKNRDQKFEIIPSWDAMMPFVRSSACFVQIKHKMTTSIPPIVLPIMVHAQEVRQIKAAVTWAEKKDFKIIIAGGRDAWMIAGTLAQKKIPVIYDNVFTQPPRDSQNYDVQFTAPEMLRKAGVKVAFSIGADTFNATLVKNLPYEAAQAVAFGLPHDEALKAISLYPAQIIGVDDRLGSIEVGKDATLFACDGDILDLRANVKHVWISGKKVSLESRHTHLYEKYRNRPKVP